MASREQTILIVDEPAGKEESADAYAESLTTHKVRSGWFQAREAWPLREAPSDLLTSERARANSSLPPAPGSAQWASVGPVNIGGRLTCAVCHPTDPERLWAGAAGGGVWYSPDAGKSWQALWHEQDSLNIGALALDPQEPEVIYCGTGEANLSGDSHPGVGLFRSSDAGQSWELLASADTVGLPRRIGAMAVDPFNSDHLLVGGVAHQDDDPSGLFISTNRGLAWTRVPSFIGNNPYRCHDVRFHPAEQGVIFVTISARGAKNGIWRSADGGGSWHQLGVGLPEPDLITRTSLALAPSDPDVLYAQMSPVRPTRVLGLFRSTDRGDTWQLIEGQHFPTERQMSYNNAIVVHPTNPNYVLCGGVDLHRTTDAGWHWKRVTRWNVTPGSPNYAHADHHALLMPAARPGWVYDFNDGGMDFSRDGGATWENRSNGLATNMFYDLAVAQSNGKVIAGGAQDNGTLITPDGTSDSYVRWTGGDGGWVVIDPTDVNHVFSTSQRMVIIRHRSSDGFTDVSPPETPEIKSTIWMAFVSMDSKNPRRLFAGSTRVWRTTNDGDSWQAVSEVLDGSPITALEVARGDSNRIYVGTENGGFYCSTDGGDTWSGNLASTVLPGRTITRLESRPDKAQVVYATVANFGKREVLGSAAKFGNRHVFRSADGGLNWADVDRLRLPDVPFHSIAVPAAQPTRVYVCCDVGVFVSNDEGATWENLTRNLPTVMVVDLVYHERDRTLTAATYGRGIWRLQLD